MKQLIITITILCTIAGLNAEGIQEQLDWGKQEAKASQCKYYQNFYKAQPLPEVKKVLIDLECNFN